jgi:hypothetical protein
MLMAGKNGTSLGLIGLISHGGLTEATHRALPQRGPAARGLGENPSPRRGRGPIAPAGAPGYSGQRGFPGN